MKLSVEEKKILQGRKGKAKKKAMEILVALGKIYGAKKLIPVKSVQVAGVSYHNVGEAGLQFLQEMSKAGRVEVLTTLNPAGMDLRDWKKLGITKKFAEKQLQVIEAFKKMGVNASCTCTPYFVGNCPEKGEHIAWSESSAVCFANSILEAYSNRESGMSALAAALVGKTPEYGMHLGRNRKADAVVEVKGKLSEVPDFGALGMFIGKRIGNKIPFIKGIENASVEQLKSLCASIATYGGTEMFFADGASMQSGGKPMERIVVGKRELNECLKELNEKTGIDLIALGCPHCSLDELRKLAELLEGKKVKKEFWVCVSRGVKKAADALSYVKVIEASGAKIAADTCMAVAPLKGRFKGMLTDSAKACYYARGNNNFRTRIASLDECVKEALK